jgi:DNA repair exonuclease SbcCD ATPase subunit
MADVKIGAELKLDTGQSFENLKQLQDYIKKTKDELNNAKYGTEEYAKAQANLTQATSLLNPEVSKQAGAMGSLKKVITDTVPGFKMASEGATGFGSTLKALLANPIVLMIAGIVAGLKFLYEAFQHSFAGAQKLEQVWAGLSKAAEVLLDRIMKMGGAIVKFFSGDFSGAFADAKAAVTGVGDEISAVYDKTVELTAKIQKLQREQLDDDLDKKKRVARLAQLKEELNDEDISVKEKMKIAQDLKADQEQNAKEDLERITKLNNAKIELLKIGTDAELKNKEEIVKLQGEIEDTKTENANEERQTDKAIRNLQKQSHADEMAEMKEKNDAYKARIEELRNYKNKVLQLQQEYDLLITKDEDEKARKDIQNKLANEKRSLQLDLEQKKISRAQYNNLSAELDKIADAQLGQLKDKKNKDDKEKEKAFQKELTGIKEDTALQAVVDVREKEKSALDKSYKEKRQQTLDNEKLSAQQREQILEALEVQNRSAHAALEKKYQLEDQTKEREYQLKKNALTQSFLNSQKIKDFTALRANLDEKAKIEAAAYQADLLAAGDNAQKKRDIELSYSEQTNAITQSRMKLSEEEKNKRLEDAQAIGGALDALSNLVGQQTATGKALSVAAAVINTYTGATKALAQGGIAGIAGAIAVTAAGIASVKKIIDTKVPGTSSTASTPSLSTVSAPLSVSPQVSNTQLNADQVNQIGNAAAARAFVVESDIQNNRERITRLNRAARIA